MRAPAPLLFLRPLLALLRPLPVLLLVACEEPAKAPEAPHVLPPDKTEVKMERVENFDPDSGTIAAAGADATAQAASVGTDGGDAGAGAWTGEPSDDPMIGGKQDAKVEKAIAPHRPRIRACYKKALAKEPGLSGAATFDATIGKDGKVASARFVKREGLNEDMVGCLQAAIKGMTFDAGDKSQIVALTFGGGVPAPAAAPRDKKN